MATFTATALLYALLWVNAGVLAYGITLDNIQSVYLGRAWHNRRSTAVGSFIVAMMGPIGLVVTLAAARRFTPRWRSISQQESWQAYREMFPYLAMDGFEVWLRNDGKV